MSWLASPGALGRWRPRLGLATLCSWARRWRARISSNRPKP